MIVHVCYYYFHVSWELSRKVYRCFTSDELSFVITSLYGTCNMLMSNLAECNSLWVSVGLLKVSFLGGFIVRFLYGSLGAAAVIVCLYLLSCYLVYIYFRVLCRFFWLVFPGNKIYNWEITLSFSFLYIL